MIEIKTFYVLIPLVVGGFVLFATMLMLNKKRKVRLAALSINVITTVVLVMALFSPWMNCGGLMGGGSASYDMFTSFETALDSNELNYVEDDERDSNSLVLTYYFYIEDSKTVCACVASSLKIEDISEEIRLNPMMFKASKSKISPGSSTYDPDGVLPLYDTNGSIEFPIISSTICPYGVGYTVAYLDLSRTKNTSYKHLVGMIRLQNSVFVMGSAPDPISKEQELEDEQK